MIFLRLSRWAWYKLLFSCLALGYVIYLIMGLFAGYLGPNPVEVFSHKTGEWGLYLLLLTLAITPLRRHFHWNRLAQFRRFMGLWSFAFIVLHFLAYIIFDHSLILASIIDDVIERPYITFGFMAFLLMLPLAITSFKRLQKAMGKRWLKLHQSVYLVAILGIIHYLFLVKADYLQPLLLAVVLALLLASRVYWYWRKHASA